MPVYMTECPDWDLLCCFPPNELLCEAAAESGSLGGEADPGCSDAGPERAAAPMGSCLGSGELCCIQLKWSRAEDCFSRVRPGHCSSCGRPVKYLVEANC